MKRSIIKIIFHSDSPRSPSCGWNNVHISEFWLLWENTHSLPLARITNNASKNRMRSIWKKKNVFDEFNMRQMVVNVRYARSTIPVTQLQICCCFEWIISFWIQIKCLSAPSDGRVLAKPEHKYRSKKSTVRMNGKLGTKVKLQLRVLFFSPSVSMMFLVQCKINVDSLWLWQRVRTRSKREFPICMENKLNASYADFAISIFHFGPWNLGYRLHIEL